MDKEMAAHVHERLAKMDEAIELMQDLRKTAGTGSERESKDQFRNRNQAVPTAPGSEGTLLAKSRTLPGGDFETPPCRF